MQVTAIDHYHNLFLIENVFPKNIVEQVLATDWLSLPWQRQQGQEHWLRRRIDNLAVEWIDEWDQSLQQLLPMIEYQTGINLQMASTQNTAWWLDEPGFTCAMHTDGEMPGAMQLTWIGANSQLATAFYHYKNPESLRHQFEFKPNTGYIMINSPDKNLARHLQWHAMLNPVPVNSFRLTSYTWISQRNDK